MTDHPTNPDGSPCHIPGLFEIEAELRVLRELRLSRFPISPAEHQNEWECLVRTAGRLEKEREAMIARATLLVGAHDFETLFGPAAISLETIERVAEAALGLLTSEEPPFERPDPEVDPDGYASFTARVAAHAEAMIDFVQTADEKTVLALAYLARGVMLSENNLATELVPAVRDGRPMRFFRLPDGGFVPLRSIFDLLSDLMAEARERTTGSAPEFFVRRREREHLAAMRELADEHRAKLAELQKKPGWGFEVR